MDVRLLVVASLVAVLAVPACLTPGQRREDALVQLARQTNDDLRWERWEHVMANMPRDDARAFQQRLNDVGEDLTMADYEVLNIAFRTGGEAAVVTVGFVWYSKRNPVMKKTTIDQLWEYKGSRWQLTSQRRSKGDRFGIFLEPERPADAGAPDGRSGDAG